MDLLIKNMEMPKSCEECPLFYEYYSKLEGKSVLHCRARGEGESRFSDDFDWRTKPTYEEGCPLVEVPPHGELCDKDKLKEEAGGTYLWSQAIEAIKNAPVILEASE